MVTSGCDAHTVCLRYRWRFDSLTPFRKIHLPAASYRGGCGGFLTSEGKGFLASMSVVLPLSFLPFPGTGLRFCLRTLSRSLTVALHSLSVSLSLSLYSFLCLCLSALLSLSPSLSLCPLHFAPCGSLSPAIWSPSDLGCANSKES